MKLDLAIEVIKIMHPTLANLVKNDEWKKILNISEARMTIMLQGSVKGYGQFHVIINRAKTNLKIPKTFTKEYIQELLDEDKFYTTVHRGNLDKKMKLVYSTLTDVREEKAENFLMVNYKPAVDEIFTWYSVK